jgi:hypothetical protein
VNLRKALGIDLQTPFHTQIRYDYWIQLTNDKRLSIDCELIYNGNMSSGLQLTCRHTAAVVTTNLNETIKISALVLTDSWTTLNTTLKKKINVDITVIAWEKSNLQFLFPKTLSALYCRLTKQVVDYLLMNVAVGKYWMIFEVSVDLDLTTSQQLTCWQSRWR